MKTSDSTVLLVEDDANDVFLMQRAFRKANVTNPLHVARDGQEAIDYLNHLGSFADVTENPPPTLMLLDLKMPRKNGFEILEWLRQQPGLKRMVAVVMSSSSEMTDINRAYDLGANSYLVKPGDFQTLVDLVNLLAGYWLGLNEKPEIQNEAEAVSRMAFTQTQLESWTTT
jgi:CheY-like chemotaxis protein